MMMDMMIHDDDVKGVDFCASKGQIVHERWPTQLTHIMMMMDMMMKYDSDVGASSQ